MSVLEDLKRFGPDQRARVTLDESLSYCSRLTASHYENFSVVTWLTPRKLRPHFASIYAFCRWSDDLGDEIGDRDRSLKLLEWWRGELESMYSGRAYHPVMMALAETVREFAIPIDPFAALISAFEQDQIIIEYDTFAQLLDYCSRSADPVGHLVLYLGRCFSAENAELSNATCTGLQLTNFWQDIARDLDIPRIYLPREDRKRFKVTDDDLRSKRFTPEFAGLLAFEVDRARDFLLRGQPLVQRMPRQLAVDIELFTRGGLAILDQIVAKKYDVLSRRPKLSRLTKLGLLLKAAWQIHGPGQPHGLRSQARVETSCEEGA